jgi:hypothetical protein
MGTTARRTGRQKKPRPPPQLPMATRWATSRRE